MLLPSSALFLLQCSAATERAVKVQRTCAGIGGACQLSAVPSKGDGVDDGGVGAAAQLPQRCAVVRPVQCSAVQRSAENKFSFDAVRVILLKCSKLDSKYKRQ